MTYVSFDEVKQRVSIETAMQRLGLALKKSGDQYRGPCPACKTGGDRALAVNTTKNSFYCFPASAGGDQIALVAHIQGLSQKDAAHWLLPRETEVHNSPAPDHSKGMVPLDYLEGEHPAVDAIGFPADVAKAVGLGYASKGVMRGLVAVPLRLPDGTLIAYLGIDQARLPTRFHLPQTNVVALKRA